MFYSGFVCESKIVDFLSNRIKFAKKGKGKEFQEGIQHIDEFIKDPVVKKLKNVKKIKTKLFPIFSRILEISFELHSRLDQQSSFGENRTRFAKHQSRK